jgi:hypothetical protein
MRNAQRRAIVAGLLVLPVLSVGWCCLDAVDAPAQIKVNNNERLVSPEVHEDDRQGVWALHFNFKEPRILKVNLPGRGAKFVWYMWYQVINKTGEPRFFIPFFELATENTLHVDEVLPAAQEAIRKVESPTLPMADFMNSVTIAERPIPPSLPEAAPKTVTGVAIWPDVNDRAPGAPRIKVYVSGLSNGWARDGNGIIRRKTLQLNFQRNDDGRRPEDSQIRFVGYEWTYRPTSADLLKEDETKK